MKPKVFASMTANLLYSHRFFTEYFLPSIFFRFGPYFVEPVIAGLEDGKPFLCGLDLIGAPVYANDFVAVGTAVNSLYGVCESMWRPDLVQYYATLNFTFNRSLMTSSKQFHSVY